jgi:hypothetical protein
MAGLIGGSMLKRANSNTASRRRSNASSVNGLVANTKDNIYPVDPELYVK